MKTVVIGTAGHIDHGKTLLVKALTGVDTDRLKEEKARGITIELGFAPLTLGADVAGSMVDVPGHEGLVRTMVAGAGGIDLVLLVVAADAGVMPQTREHLDICNLLRIPRGVVALTKSDLVEKDFAEYVAEDLREELKGGFLAGAPIVPCSALTGAGLEELRATLRRVALDCPPRRTDRPAYLPVDRVFTVQGFGTVVTGTLIQGQLRVGEQATVLPRATRGQVRSLQTHGHGAEVADAGVRLAVNLAGIDLDGVARGEVVVHAGELEPTRRVLAQVSALPHIGRTLKRRVRGLVCVGTDQITCDVIVHSGEGDTLEIPPGGSGIATVRLARPTVVVPGQRFILRGSARLPSYGHTFGGGVVLDPHPPERRRRAERLATASVLARGELEPSIVCLLEEAGTRGLTRAELGRRLDAGADDVSAVVKRLLKSGALAQAGEQLVAGASMQRLAEHTADIIREYHESHPNSTGMPRSELASRLHLTPQRLQQVIDGLRGRVAVADLAFLTDFRAATEAQSALLGALRDARLEPPTPDELADRLGLARNAARDALQTLLGKGSVVRVRTDMYLAAEVASDLRERVVKHIEAEGQLDAQQFKTMTGLTRKYAIPILEYLDQARITLRVGDHRVLRR